jgi:hypothetical protein
MENMVHDVQNHHQKEGEDAAGPLAKLPIEWLVQVIYWLPTQYIFTIMCVNREWECACRYVIKWRESLKVSCRPLERKSAFIILLDTVGWNRERAKQVLSSLRQMRNLIHFTDRTEVAPATRNDWLQEIAIQNAASLKSVNRRKLPDDGSVVYKRLKRLDCSTFDAGTAARLCPGMENLLVTSSVLGPNSPPLPSLKVLTVHCADNAMPLFLEKNAASLENIWTFLELPACCFPKLKVLRTGCLPGEAQVPSLQTLSLDADALPDGETPADFFLNKMTKFSVNVDHLGQGSLSQAVTRISAMENLTSLYIHIKCDPPHHPVSDLFANMHLLKDVTIIIGRSFHKPDLFLPAATWASSLFTNNPGLRDLQLRGIPVTDNDLTVCSRLTNLHKVNLGKDKDHGFTVTGILSLLRGGSCNIIANLSLTTDTNSVDIIDSEIKDMAKERSVSFTRKVHERSSPIKIRFLHGPNAPPVADGQVPPLEEVIGTQINAIMTRQGCYDDEWMITKARGSLANSFLSIPESKYRADRKTSLMISGRLNVVQEEMVFFVERRNVTVQVMPISVSYSIT